MALLQEITNNLDKINRSSGIQQVVSQASNLVNTQLAAVTTSVGTDLNTIVNGIQPLTQVLDDFSAAVPASKLSQLTGALPIAQLTQKIPGFQNDLVGKVGDARNDLNAITGSVSTTTDAFLNVVITAPFPEAIAQSLNTVVPTATAEKLRVAVDGVQQFGEGALANIQNASGVLSSLVGAVNNSTASLNGLKANLTSIFSQNVLSAASQLTSLVDNLRIELNIPDISGLNIKANQIDEGAKNWAGADTPRGYNFNMIGSHEELEVELKSTSREITGLVVHWSETFYNQDISAVEIQSFNSKEDDGIPYHYIIRRDGSLQRGRPIDQKGGSLPNNHDEYSVQIVLIGGINAPVGTPDPLRYLSSNSFTRQQMNTFDIFLEKAYMTWPGLQAMGHNDIDRQQRDPGFDVPDYVYNKFGKRLTYTDPSAQQAMSRAMISTTRVTI